MDKKVIIANWKSNKTVAQTKEFFENLEKKLPEISLEKKEIIICPPFTALQTSFELVKTHNLPVFLGAQTVSSFPEGAYTGEIAASQIKELAEYVIIGHSERRRYQKEDKEMIEQKIQQANAQNLKVILCIQDENDYVSENIEYIAYEPPTAISTFGVGKAETPEDVAKVFENLLKRTNAKLLYGGSVNPDNIAGYSSVPTLSGYLVGAKSLEVDSLIALLKNS